ncbi:MAG TPA: hypothetical protein VN756_07950 [Solirubrobacterales bacterium]|nr:hypothetical protein [Solirubrobacterales bacterium]
MSRWKLTIRHGSDVSHESFDDLDQAVAKMREHALGIRAEGPVKAVSALRDFGPEQQIHARLLLTGRGLLRKPIAGVDVRGDGTFMPFRGRVAREELDPSDYDTPFDAVRETLAGRLPDGMRSKGARQDQ